MGRTAFATASGAILANMAEFDFALREKAKAPQVSGEDRYKAEQEKDAKSAKEKVRPARRRRVRSAVERWRS